MDIRRLMITLAIAILVMVGFEYFRGRWGKNGNEEAKPANQLVYPAIPEKPTVREQGALPVQIELGDPQKNSKDKLAILVNNQTAGIDHAWLNVNEYSEYPRERRHPTLEPLTLFASTEGVAKPFSTLGVHVTLAGQAEECRMLTSWDDLKNLSADERIKRINKDNATAVYSTQYVWKVARQTPTEVDLVMRVINDGVPVVEITKIFRIDPSSYDMVISHQVTNLTNQPLKVAIDQMASLDLPRDETQTGTRFYHAAGLDTKGRVIAADRFNMLHTELKKIEGPRTEEIGKFVGPDQLLWVATSNRFFAALTQPTQTTGVPFTLFDGKTIPVVDHVAAAHIDILDPSAKDMQASTDVADIVSGVRLEGAPVEIAANATANFPLLVFLGPKKENILQGSIHAAVGTPEYTHALFKYDTLIQFSTGCYSFCTFGIGFDGLAYLLLHILDFFKSTVAFGNYGVAIMILVLLIRAALHPLTRMSQIKMAEMGKKMKDIQPLIEANKKKYAKDKQKQNEEMMRIYREHHVNPAGGVMGCLPMLIQMPIWIAMWAALRADINLRHAVFVPGWINDLSAPDMTVVFHPIVIPLVGVHVSALNILPLLLGTVFFIQMQVQTASQPVPADAQQASMQKMTKYFSLLFPLFLYNFPSGLNLYYFASTLGGLVDTYFVRKTLKKRGILPATAQVLPTHEEKE